MNSKVRFLSLLLVMICTRISFATEPAEALARKAISDNVAESSRAVAELRSLGPAGLEVLMVQYADEIRRQIANPTAAPDQEWQRIALALDAVAQQKNSYVAGLYWHTDLDEAKRVSTASGKPILSLRLLGKLTDELSCANSRFFRAVLYPNAEVSTALRERFVLHWESVRPVPTITIDFGDGRKLERTLAGNSIHYVLDSQARPLDAFPGLYGPQAFLRGLTKAESLFKSLVGKSDSERDYLLMKYYGEQHNKLAFAWASDTAKTGGKLPKGFVIEKDANGEALSIAPLAVTKALTETTILRAMTAATDALGQITDEAAWKRIAQLHSPDASLDSLSLALIRHQNPTLTEQELSRLLHRFQELIALDTVRNEYLMHAKLYTWFMRDPARNNLLKLNEKVYASLFLTPSSDPWLGLFSTDVYTALDSGGMVKP